MPLLLGTRNGVWAATTLQTPGLNFRKYELQPPGTPALVPGNVSMRETPVGAELLVTQSDGLILKLDIDSHGALRIQRLAHVKVPPGEVALGAFRDGPLETIAGSTFYVLTAPPAASSSIGPIVLRRFRL